MTQQQQQIIKLLEERGHEVYYGKGGYFVKDIGFITTKQAQKLTGVEPQKREHKERITAWGDYATIAMLNGRRA